MKKWLNAEGYADPTASQAIETISNEERKIHKLIHIFRDIASLAGFNITSRVELEHKESGRRYK